MQLKAVRFLITGLLLATLSVGGLGDDHPQGRLLVVVNGTIYQETCLIPDSTYFVPEGSLASFENMLIAASTLHIGRVPIAEGTFSCYLLNRDVAFPPREQGSLLCLSPELQTDKTGRDEDGPVIGGSGEREKDNTSLVLPEWPTPTPESTWSLSGSYFPFDPPLPPFMPIPVKGLFDMPDWQSDYLLSLAWINRRLNQWLSDWYHPTSSKSGQVVSTSDLSTALEEVRQERTSIQAKLPLDASELLTQLTGKDLPGDHLTNQAETVMLYPVYMLPQSASNSLEEAQGVEFAGEMCSICLANFEESDDMVKTPCAHLFHMDCLKLWLTTNIEGKTSKACPCCRQDVDDLRSYLTHKEIAISQERAENSARAGLQEATQIIMEALAGTRTWPENDDDDYIRQRLKIAQRSADPAIAGQARALFLSFCLYSVQHLVSQVQAGTAIWPDDDEYIRHRLESAKKSADPAIAGQAQALRPLIEKYAHKASR